MYYVLPGEQKSSLVSQHCIHNPPTLPDLTLGWFIRLAHWRLDNYSEYNVLCTAHNTHYCRGYC